LHRLTPQSKTAKELVLPTPRKKKTFAATIKRKLAKKLIASG
jgi:hypothetical protein